MQTVQFPAKFEFLDEIREFVGNIARENGFNDKAVYNIQLAADEAASNAIEHAYNGITDGMLDISCGIHGGIDVDFTLLSCQTCPVYAGLPAPDIHADLGDRKIGGLGIFLMRKLMDDVEYDSNARAGNNLKMTKRKA